MKTTILKISPTILLLMACGGSSGVSPESVAQEYLDAIQAGDATRAQATLCAAAGFGPAIEVRGVAGSELGEMTTSDEDAEPDYVFNFTYTQADLTGAEVERQGEIEIVDKPMEYTEEVNKELAASGIPGVEIEPENFNEGPCVIGVWDREPN